MALPTTDTVVTYPAGGIASTGTVLHVSQAPDGRTVVLLDTTAAHPVDSAWPDQPADRGELIVDGTALALIDCVVGATDGAELFLGSDIPVRKGTEGWAFVVAHLVDGPVAEGASAEVRVDATYRRALSAGHTGCHLASLALNAGLAGAWTKEVAIDSLGHPNFDAIAIEVSTITEFGSIDVYRIGKSLRKRGFTTAVLVDSLEDVVAGANAQLAQWRDSAASVEIVREGDGLTARREWHCDLPGHPVSIPCGGTHLANLGELAGLRIALEVAELDGALELRMTTTAR
ncbi:MAG TPA: metal-dependent hydrolase [Galbitalea sp.]